MNDCKCTNPTAVWHYYDCFLGMDETNGRFGEVCIRKCMHCDTLWLYYFLEYHFHSRSGRWFRGVITAEDALQITPANAIEYLNRLDWHFRGGSFFEHRGFKTNRPIGQFALL